MQRRRQPPRLHLVDDAAAGGPPVAAVPVDLVRDAQPVVQVDQVRAAAEQHVLAVVDDAARARIAQARRPAAETLAGLDDDRNQVRAGQPHRRGDAREPAPDDDDAALHAVQLPVPRIIHRARTAIAAFVTECSRIRRPETTWAGLAAAFSSSSA